MAIAAGFAGKACAVFALMATVLLGAAHAQCADPFHIAAPTGAVAFTQTRHLSGVARPLVSHGQAQVGADRLQWHVTQPVDILTVISPAGVTQSIEGGPAQSMGPQGGDAFMSSSGLLDIMRGDFTAARTHYEVAALPAAASGDWRLRLTPRSAQMARFISFFEVQGCDAVGQVKVQQAGGDWMEIQLAPPAS
jgi:hypothetical protein